MLRQYLNQLSFRQASDTARNGQQAASQAGSPEWDDKVDSLHYARVMALWKFEEREGLQLASVYKDSDVGSGSAGGIGSKRLQRLHKELRYLPEQLLQHPSSSAWVRYDSDMPQYIQAAITGPQGTPYESGIFLFDVYCPDAYPQIPPKVTFLTTARGKVRFSPNLYTDGKVCLSLLGTFDGPRWDPASSLYQVLMSIQGMILGVAHPLFNEPGLGGFENGSDDSPAARGGGHVSGAAVRRYDERTQLATLQVNQVLSASDVSV